MVMGGKWAQKDAQCAPRARLALTLPQSPPLGTNVVTHIKIVQFVLREVAHTSMLR